jgi:hypothetical protein
MDPLIEDIQFEFQRHKKIAEKAMGELDDSLLVARPAAHINPVALIVKHLAGNLRSRWTDFLTSDGEKPTRNRDGEFELTEADTRANLMEAWERGWSAVLGTVGALDSADLDSKIMIRGEPLTVRQALLRGLNHVAYHTGQILYIVRLLKPESTWITIPPGKSHGVPGQYRSRP